MYKKEENEFRTSAQRSHGITVTPCSYHRTMKRCTKCGLSKPPAEFYAVKGGRDGLRGDCKACHAARAKAWYAKNRVKAIANVKRWQQENAEHVRAYRREHNASRTREIRAGHLRRTFGLSLDDYDAMLAAQGGGCAICGEQPMAGQSLHIDHLGDVVRGILCIRCNNALGLLKEDTELVGIARDYIDCGGFVTPGVYEARELAVGRARGLVKGSG